jgi:hypothetical protein
MLDTHMFCKLSLDTVLQVYQKILGKIGKELVHFSKT